jgi:hypothetical protein
MRESWELTLPTDGIEMHFTLNHIGHFLLTNLFLGKLRAAAQRPSSPRNCTHYQHVQTQLLAYSL